jgi:cell division septation protein DedD
VVEPAADAPAAVFRVRVGRYADRAEAEDILRRLEQEEQFKPWITR